jgi:hypothetical protein
MSIAKRHNNAKAANPAVQQNKKSKNNIYNIEQLKISCILANIFLIPRFSLIQKILVCNQNDLHLSLVCNQNDLHSNSVCNHNDLSLKVVLCVIILIFFTNKAHILMK